MLVNVTGGENMTISEAEKVAEMIQAKVSPNARIIWGAAVDPALEDTVRVMVVITGVKSKNILGPEGIEVHQGDERRFHQMSRCLRKGLSREN